MSWKPLDIEDILIVLKKIIQLFVNFVEILMSMGLQLSN